jgi:2-methylisocitrate lyase-like PEP mutase family enzyme
MTGFGATASRLGRPDIGLLTQTEMTTHARDMARAVSIPIIADADTGYGGPANIARTVEEYAQAGVAAIHLEDQVAPKRCGQLAGIKLIPAEENVRRLKCAIASRPAQGPLIIGRTDALPAIGPEEAVRRALMYQDAGVDLVFVDGIKKISEVEIVARQVPGPKVVSIVDGNETVALTAHDLEQMGFAVVFYAVTALFSAAKAMADALAILKRDGTPAKAASAMMSYAEFSALVDLPRFQALDETYG